MKKERKKFKENEKKLNIENKSTTFVEFIKAVI